MGGTADYGNYMEKHEEGKLGGDTRPGASITSLPLQSVGQSYLKRRSSH